MRNLALRAADAAKSTTNLIDNTIKAVKKGNELTQETQSAFKNNVEISGKIGKLVDEIVAASQEQAQGVGEVSKAIMEMNKVTQQSAANAEESASAAEILTSQTYIVDLVALVRGTGQMGRSRRSFAEAAGSPEISGLRENAPPGFTVAGKNTFTGGFGKMTGKKIFPEKSRPNFQKMRPAEALPLEGEFKEM